MSERRTSRSEKFAFELARPTAEKEAFLAALRHFAGQRHWAPGVVSEIELLLEEWLANIVHHNPGRAREPAVRISIRVRNQEAVLEIEDDGAVFNPTLQPPPDLSLPPEERPIGGLGIFMMRKLTRSMVYRRKREHNFLLLRKDLRQPVLGQR